MEADEAGRRQPERERVHLYAAIDELNLELPINNRLWLADRLVQALAENRAIPTVVDVNAIRRARRTAVATRKRTGLPVRDGPSPDADHAGESGSPTAVTASSAERTDSKFVVNPTRRTITVPPMGSERTSDHSSRSSQLLKPPLNEQNRAWQSISWC